MGTYIVLKTKFTMHQGVTIDSGIGNL